MARGEVHKLDTPRTAPTTGAPLGVVDMENKWLQMGTDDGGAYVATIVVEGTIDGVTWLAIQTFANTTGLVAIPETFLKIRARTTAYTSGQPTAWLAGHNRRAH